jgi:predicted dehydrogenase
MDAASHPGKGVRWGILGVASIARRALIPAIEAAAGQRVTAIASRDPAKAREAAESFDIPHALLSYGELVAHPEVDAVYIPLPNHLHIPWTIRALEAGKHVLCEKPFALDAVEARTLLPVAERHPGLKVMEAFMYRFHPRWRAVHRMVQSGELGELRSVHTHFAYHNVDPANVRNMPGIGGGALLDIGCYGISVARWLFGREPERVEGEVEMDPAFGVDRKAAGTLYFGTGRATFLAATQMEYRQQVAITTSEALLTIAMPFNPKKEQPTALHITRGGATESIEFPPSDQYMEMVEAFAAAVRDDTDVPTPLADAVRNMEVIDAVT